MEDDLQLTPELLAIVEAERRLEAERQQLREHYQHYLGRSYDTYDLADPFANLEEDANEDGDGAEDRNRT